MSKPRLDLLFVGILLLFAVLGCKDIAERAEKEAEKAKTTRTPLAATTPEAGDGAGGNMAVSASAPIGKDIPPPAAGTANVWGQVMFNSAAVPKNEVKLCEKLNSFNLQCTGKNFRVQTNEEGEFLFANVPPLEYQGLIVRVFDSRFYVFEASIANLPKKYKIEADKTFYVTTTNLFKDDLKVTAPKAGAKAAADGLEITWAEYPNAEYYKVSLYWTGKEYKSSPYINERIDGTTLVVDKPLEDGQYRISVSAFNSDDIKLAQNNDEHKFTVTGGAPAAATGAASGAAVNSGK
jgi:hypothetical protein